MLLSSFELPIISTKTLPTTTPEENLAAALTVSLSFQKIVGL